MVQTLPRELQTHIVRELFRGAHRDFYTADKAARIAFFIRLRLVASHIKVDAHAAWPGGLAVLAKHVVEKLLKSAGKGLLPTGSPAAFRQELEWARPVLEETPQLDFVFPRGDGSRDERDDHDRACCTGIQQILAATHALVLLDSYLNNATVALQDLPISHLQLRQLNLSYVQLQSLAGWNLSQLDTLDSLRVSGSGMRGIRGMSASDKSLHGLQLPPRASSIALSNFGLSSDEIDLLGLEALPNLRHLDLSGSRSTRPLPNIPSLKYLVIQHSELTDLLLETLAPWDKLEKVSVILNSRITSASPFHLDTNHSIRRLDLTATGFHDPATLALSTNNTLQCLILEETALASLAFDLANNEALRELDMGKCQVTAEDMHQLAGQLARNRTLSKLCMRYCELDNWEIRHLVLEKTSGLEELDLSGNDFDDAGLRPLADSITEHGLLRNLKLCHCYSVTPAFVAGLRTSARVVEM